jgi:hypothetical protein
LQELKNQNLLNQKNKTDTQSDWFWISSFNNYLKEKYYVPT